MSHFYSKTSVEELLECSTKMVDEASAVRELFAAINQLLPYKPIEIHWPFWLCTCNGLVFLYMMVFLMHKLCYVSEISYNLLTDYWISGLNSVASCDVIKMHTDNLAKIFGPTVLGYSIQINVPFSLKRWFKKTMISYLLDESPNYFGFSFRWKKFSDICFYFQVMLHLLL